MMSSDVTAADLKQRRQRRGLTLIEAAMVLIVLAMVVSGLILLYQRADTGRRIAVLTEEFHLIRKLVRDAAAADPNYGSADLTARLTAGCTAPATGACVLPAGMLNGAGVNHAFNGAVTVSGAGNRLLIKFDRVPMEACLQLATADMGRGVTTLRVEESPTGTHLTLNAPFSAADASTACATPSRLTAMTWTTY